MVEVLYEDNHIIVCVKPAGILSQSDNTGDEDMLSLLKKYVKEKYDKPGNVFIGLVHRLDRQVGGVMVYAKTSKAASRLSESIRNHSFTKEYLAVVHGNADKTGELRDYLLKNEKLNKSFVVSRETAGAKESILSYEKLGKAFAGNKQEISLLKINLKTGRHHQIRVQFSSRGLPLMGDTKYSSFKENCNIALWAYHLSFKHPVRDEMVDIEYYPPKEFPWNLFD